MSHKDIDTFITTRPRIRALDRKHATFVTDRSFSNGPVSKVLFGFNKQLLYGKFPLNIIVARLIISRIFITGKVRQCADSKALIKLK